MFNPFTPTWNTLGAHYKYSRTIFTQDISTEITFRKILRIIKYFVIKNIKHFPKCPQCFLNVAYVAVKMF